MLRENPKLYEEVAAKLGRGKNAQPTVPHPHAAPTEDGATLVRDVESFLNEYLSLPRFVSLPSALWAMATHCYGIFSVFPYLGVSSPTKGCGKTTFLRCVQLLSHEGKLFTNPSEASLFRIIEELRPTLLIDETEPLRGKHERSDYLNALFNSGNRRSARVPRCEAQGKGKNYTVIEYSVYCPKGFACIGNLPETISDRAICFTMQKRRKTDRTLGPFVEEFVEEKATPLHARIASFIESRQEEIRAAYRPALTSVIEFLPDRDADSWGPLFALLAVIDSSRIAELKESAEGLTSAKVADAQDDNLSLRLLADIRSIWPAEEPKIFTAELLNRLKGMPDGPWASDEKFDGRKLGRLMKPFKIKPRGVQIGEVNLKGYYREEFQNGAGPYLEFQPSDASELL
ncbi:MAG TPA: DUF3631 domain-containing protein [Candidatus Acidoferrales bacterium]